MNRIMKTAATGVLALSLAAVGTSSALADDITPPTEEASSPSTVVADATPDTAAPSSTETSPSTVTSTDDSSAAATAPESSTSVSPGPAVESVASPTSPSTEQKIDPASIPTLPQYHGVLWANDVKGQKFPQTLVATSEPSDTFDVHELDAKAVTPDTCYQYDAYANNRKTDALITSAHLTGSGEFWVGGSWKPEFSNTFCTPPAPPAAQPCVATGGTYTESDDRAPVLVPAGYSFVSQGDHTPVEIGYPLSGNLQGINNISYTTTDTVGYGIFFRFVVDLTGDGLGGYNSLSITTPTITQASVADVGSKGVFLGHTIAEIAAQYPHNKITSGHWQTGSSYPAGDGATLTGVSGDCGGVNYATVQPEPTTRVDVVTDDAVCTVNEDGTFPGGGTITTTTTNYETPFVWDAETAKFVAGEEVVVGEPIVTTVDATLEECPATVVIVTPPTTTPTADPSPSTSPAPIVKASDNTLAYTGIEGGALVGIVILAFLLLVAGAAVAVLRHARRRTE